MIHREAMQDDDARRVAAFAFALAVGAAVLAGAWPPALTAVGALALTYVSLRLGGVRRGAPLILAGVAGMAFLAPGPSSHDFLAMLPLAAAVHAPSLAVRVAEALGMAVAGAALVALIDEPAEALALLHWSLPLALLAIVLGSNRQRSDSPSPAPKEASGSLTEKAELQTIAEQVVRLREEERRRLARDLHDGAGQLIHGLRLEIDLAKLQGEGESLSRMESLVARLGESVREILADLRPAILDDAGLAGAIEALAGEVADAGRVTVEADVDRGLEVRDQVVAIALYRIAQEALSNAVRHASAQVVRVVLKGAEQGVLLIVADDGQGIRDDDERGYGLKNMAERAALIGGDLQIASGPQGTSVRLSAPLVFDGASISSVSVPVIRRKG
ncbi:MAG: ATP-binding protein [Myxococcota bacterium]